ncbi:type VI secretion system baseplate subunit TssG, partial [Burkholderia pseudomallei]|uniref:type VI secretion system baseplate subunit TssG n=1 Tax=Burkholderia pseudomallei TaxID=28450 RepID=UPI00158945FE
IVLGVALGALVRELMPGGDAVARLRLLVRLYLTQPFAVDVVVRVRARDAAPARGGRRAASRVGLDARLRGASAERAAS